MTYQAEVLADTPLAYLRLGDASGTTAADSSGNSHPGTYVGTKTLGVTGALAGNADTAVSVAGAGGVSLALNLSSSNKITIEFWVKWPYPAADQVLIEYTADGMGAGGFALNNRGTVEFSKRRWRVEMGTTHSAEFGGDPSGANPPTFANPATPNKWHHVVIELDRTIAGGPGLGGSIRLWVDAVPRNKTTTAGTTAVGGNFANGTLYIGGRSLSSLMATATFDELAIYNGLLSQARIDQHYLIGSGLTWIHPGAKNLDIRDIFPSANVWEDALPGSPTLHPSSAIWRENLISQLGLEANVTGPIRSQVGDPGYRSLSYWAGTSCLYVVPDTQPLVPVAVGEVVENWAWDRMYDLHTTLMAGVPIPDHAINEISDDHNVTIFQPGTGKYWEFWACYHNPANEGSSNPGTSGRDFEWICYGGGAMRDVSLSDGTFRDRFEVTPPNRQYEYYFDGQCATSLPIAGGIITLEEWNAGVINHALHLEVGNAWTTFVYPAHRGDGQMDATWIPEGAWLRVDPTVNLDTLYPGSTFNQRKVRMLAKAAQTYGILITDKTAVGCAFRMRSVYSYSAEAGTGEHPWDMEVGEDGFLREWDIMGNFPWGAIQVLDPAWVEARWPPDFVAEPAPSPIGTLTDDFSGSLDILKWPTQGAGIAISGGRLHIPCVPAYPRLRSASTWNLTASEALMEVVSVPGTIELASEGGMAIRGSIDDNCYVEMYFSGTPTGNQLICEWRGPGPSFTRTKAATPTYDSVLHRWWKIRKAANIVYWETSADGVTWTQQAALDWATSGWTIDTLDKVSIDLFSGNWQGQTGATDFIVDNLNVQSTTPFAPTDVTGLAAWWKADALSLSDHDPVATWTDSSPFGRSLTQSIAGRKPVFRTGQVNGHPAVAFDGIDDYLSTTAFASPTDGVTVMAVCAADTVDELVRTLFCHAASATWNAQGARVLVRVNGATTYGWEGLVESTLSHANKVIERRALTEGFWQLVEFHYDQEILKLYHGDQLTSAKLREGILTSSTQPAFLGANTGGGENFSGRIAEIVVYSRAV